VAIVVCDSFGVGEAPDAAAYGDTGSNTLGNTARAVGGLAAPNLTRLGLGHLTEIPGVPARAEGQVAYGKSAERSAGKDTTTGHWEMSGIVLDRPFPLYPHGFPPEVIEPFERRVGRPVLGNRPASGTEIIDQLGQEHLATGNPIVYTSGDSVFQVATHVDIVSLETLYEWCLAARAILQGDNRVGRVIARPFDGEPGAFVRRPERRDYSVPPPQPTLLDFALAGGVHVLAVGKIRDIYDGRGITDFRYSDSDDHGMDVTIDWLRDTEPPTLVVTNLVDFDSKYGHRGDPRGYARAVESFDRRLPDLVSAVGDGLLFITGDHGCDPTDDSTDHTREYVPVLVAGTTMPGPVDLGTRESFADIGATVADALGISTEGLAGTSFAGLIGAAA
jgi:phosphopentomutase